GTVRDMEHRKMSKSLGNGIDPLDVVRLYGADALRWTIVAGLGLGVDVMLDPNDLEKSFGPGRNFCTKLWNIGRFLLSRVGSEPVRDISSISAHEMQPADAWILARLNEAIKDCDIALGPPRPGKDGHWKDGEHQRGLRLSEYAEAARRFVWNELADWYLESAKPRLAAAGGDREVCRAVLAHAFDGALRLLHPMVPFITEELWQKLPQTPENEFLARAPWPQATNKSSETRATFELMREAVMALRQIRSEYGVQPGVWVDAALIVPTDEIKKALATQFETVASMIRTRLTFADEAGGSAAAHQLLSRGIELVVPLAGLIDLEKEIVRLTTELEQLTKQLSLLDARLANDKFTAKAPPELVAAERAKAEAWRARCTQIAARIKALGQ
ncbi:MAG: class I tRNA ligase family protein, partial [Gemmatimonadaceae bacterium]